MARSRSLALTEAQAAQVERMWRGFMTPQDIARHLGVHVASVKVALRQPVAAGEGS